MTEKTTEKTKISDAERQRQYRQRLADKGLKEVRGLYATKEQEEKLRAYFTAIANS